MTVRGEGGDGNGRRPIRVLIADDEPDVRLLLRIQLSREGFEVAGEAEDGPAVLERCPELHPDAVVLDLLMPGMTGIEVIPLLQADAPDVGIVAYTAVAGEFVRDQMARLGVPLLLKSGDVTALAAALRDVAR